MDRTRALSCILIALLPLLAAARRSASVLIRTDMEFVSMDDASLETPAFGPGVNIYSEVRAPVEPASWKMRIHHFGGGLLRTFEGGGRPPEKLYWMGVGEDGRLAANAFYQADLVVTSREGEELRSPLIDITLNKPAELSALQREDILIAEDPYKLTLRFPTIDFEPGQTELDPASYQVLDAAAEFLKRCLHTKIVVIGFTDDTGTPEANRAVSERRARIVRRFLTESRGLPADAVRFAGLADEFPLADNSTVQGRDLNRRVEIWVSKLNLS